MVSSINESYMMFDLDLSEQNMKIKQFGSKFKLDIDSVNRSGNFFSHILSRKLSWILEMVCFDINSFIYLFFW